MLSKPVAIVIGKHVFCNERVNAMTEKTKKILFMIVLPSVLALALAGSLVWGATQSAKAENLQNVTGGIYNRAYSELTEDMYDLQMTLSKLMVVGSSTLQILLLNDVWRLSGSAVGLMSQVPASHVDTEGMNTFIVRVGDYAKALTKKLIQGKPMSDDDMTQLAELRDTCGKLASDMQSRIDAGDVPSVQLSGDAYYEPASNETDKSQQEGNVQEFPTLIYDGPFSESAEKAEARGLTGEQVTIDQARENAQKVLPDGATVATEGESNGDIPSYEFTFTLQDGRQADVSITKQGGSVLYMMTTATSDVSGVAPDDESKKLKEIGKTFLSEHGFENMESTYAQYYSGIALINFAATQNDVILYPDLVKVWIDRATGTVCGMDARNYFFSHVERTLDEPKLTIEEAENIIRTI